MTTLKLPGPCDPRPLQTHGVLFTLQILLLSQQVAAAELDLLLRPPGHAAVASPVDFLSQQAWAGIKVSTGP